MGWDRASLVANVGRVLGSGETTYSQRTVCNVLLWYILVSPKCTKED